MATGAVIVRILSQYSEKGSKAAQKDIAKLGKQFDKFSTKITKAYAIAAAAAGAFAVKIGKDSVKAAIADQKSQAILANTIQNVLGGTKEQIAAIEDYISKTEMLTAVQDDELRPSLGKLISVTKDASLAMYLNNIALDLAAKAGVDVGTATDAITKALRGQFKGLQSLGIGLDATTVKTKNIGKAFETTAAQTKGAAKAAADADPYARLAIQFDNLKKSIGYALLPVITQFSEYLIKVLLPSLQTWISLHQNEIQTALITTANAMTSLIQGMVKFDSFLRKIHISLVSFSAAIIAIINIAKLSIVIGQFIGWFIAITKARAEMQLLAATTAGATPIIATAGATAQAASAGFTALGFGTASATGALGGFLAKMGMGSKAIKWVFAIINPLKKIAIALAVIYATSKLLETLWKKLFGGNSSLATDLDRKYTRPAADSAQTARKEFEAWTKATEDANAEREQAAKLAKLTADADAKALKDAKEKARLDAIKARIAKKFGVSLTDPDTQDRINAAAILYNLERGRKNAQAEIIKQAQILKDLNKAALEEEIKLRSRLDDILRAYSDDQKIDIIEIGILAQKWKVTADVAALYVEQIVAVSDQKISDDEVTNLSLMWGISKDQAGKYLDFVKVVSDGKISDEEIRNLATKWNMTIKEAQKYADFIIAVQDRELNDAEVQRLKDKWGLTNDEVTDYIVSIGAPVKYQGTILDPSQIDKLTTAWNAALAALLKYKAALGQTGFSVLGPTNTDPNAPGNQPAAIAAAAAAAEAAAAAAADAANALAESEKALAESTAALESATTLGSIRTATSNEELNAAVNLATLVGESASDIANAMMVGLLGQGVDAANAASSARYTGQAIAEMQRRQQAAAEEAAARARAFESFRTRETEDYLNMRTGMDLGGDGFRGALVGSSTINNAKSLSGGNLMAGGNVNVTVNVAGSVTAEQDLVQTVRNGLLAAQYNGNQVLLEAI